MKRLHIGILTFHRSVNYGAVMQCYALTERIKRDFPDDTVEVIDYVPQFRVKQYFPSFYNFLFGNLNKQNALCLNIKLIIYNFKELITHPSTFIKKIKRYRVFQDSLSYLPLSQEKYRSDIPDKFRNAVIGKYDIIVVGSDCVWEWSTVPLPNVYYLPGDYQCVKMAYAASAGVDDYHNLSKSLQTNIKECLRDFYYVGLRDSSVENNVKGLCPELKFYHNCDPTTFIDISTLSSYKETAKNKLRKRGISFNKPIVCIMGNDNLGKMARSIFGDHVQYVGVYAINHCCDVFINDFTVLEWAAAFSLYDLTFTTFFHGTMLSLVNLTPVMSFDYLPESSSHITKLHELFLRMNLVGFYHRWSNNYSVQEFETVKNDAMNLFQNPPTEMIQNEISKEALNYASFKDALYKLH